MHTTEGGDKFSTIGQIFEPVERMDLEEVLLIYSAQLGDKNPFLPLSESLKKAGGTLDEQRVFSSFNEAYRMYQRIMSMPLEHLEYARLYKLGGAGETALPYRKALTEKTRVFQGGTIEEVKVEIHKMCNSQDTEASILGKAFLEEQNNIELAYAQQSPIAKSNQLKQIYGRIFKDGILKQLSIAFFKTDRTKEQLQALNAIYKPGDIHSWGANLAWLLGHLRRGNQFVVCSDILSHQYRRGFQSEKIPCAFARELCVALKAGYTLCKNETGVILKPPSLTPEYLQKCDSTGVLGDGVNPTYEEAAEVYRQLEQANWNSQKNFECSFYFKDGVVQMKVLSQPEIPSATDISRELASVLENITDLSRNLGGISEGPAVLNQFTPQALEQETLVQSVSETNKPASEGVDCVISSEHPRPQK